MEITGGGGLGRAVRDYRLIALTVCVVWWLRGKRVEERFAATDERLKLGQEQAHYAQHSLDHGISSLKRSIEQGATQRSLVDSLSRTLEAIEAQRTSSRELVSVVNEIIRATISINAKSSFSTKAILRDK